MVRHTKVIKTTKIAVGDEVLYQGHWKKVTGINIDIEDLHAYFTLDFEIITTLISLIPEWEVEVFKDFSDSAPEYSINLINRTKASINKKIILFNETGIAATKGNLEKLTAIANNVKDYMNKEGIDFEEEELCR